MKVLLIVAALALASRALFATPQSTGSAALLLWKFDSASNKYHPQLSLQAVHDDSISAVALDTDLLASGTLQGVLSIWKIGTDPLSTTLIKRTPTHPYRIIALTANATSNIIRCYFDNGLSVQYQLLSDGSLLSIAESNLADKLSCSGTTSSNPYPSKATDSGCRVDCSQIGNAEAEGPSSFECICGFGYLWAGDQCLKVFEGSCDLFDHALAAESACKCEDGYEWSGYGCVSQSPKVGDPCIGGACNTINCAQMAHSPKTNFNNTACDCDSGYFWNSTAVKCYINCSGVANSASSTAVDFETCSCAGGFYFQNASCILNCSQVNGAGSSTSNGTACNCNSGRSWNSTARTCDVQPSKLALGLGIGLGIFGALVLIGGTAGLIYCMTRKPQPSNAPPEIYTMKSFAGSTATTIPPTYSSSLPISSQLPYSGQLPHSNLIPSSKNVQFLMQTEPRYPLTSETHIRAT